MALCAPCHPSCGNAHLHWVVLVPDNYLVIVRLVQGVAERSLTVMIPYHSQAYLTVAKASSQICVVHCLHVKENTFPVAASVLLPVAAWV